MQTNLEPFQIHEECVSNNCELRGNDRQNWDVDTIELVETPPRTALAQTGEYLAHGLLLIYTSINYRIIEIYYGLEPILKKLLIRRLNNYYGISITMLVNTRNSFCGYKFIYPCS